MICWRVMNSKDAFEDDRKWHSHFAWWPRWWAEDSYCCITWLGWCERRTKEEFYLVWKAYPRMRTYEYRAEEE